MSLLGAFLSSAGSAYMKDKEETRKMEAELLKAKKLEEFRRETNRMDAEMQHGYRMDEQAQSHKDAMGRVMAQDVIDDRNTKEEREYQAELLAAANKREDQQSLKEFQRWIAKTGVEAKINQKKAKTVGSGQAIVELGEDGKPVETYRNDAATSSKSPDALQYAASMGHKPGTAEFQQAVMNYKHGGRGKSDKYNPQTAAKHIQDSLYRVMGGRLEMGKWTLPEGNSQEFSRLNAIAQSIENKHPRRWSPGELAELVYSNRAMLASKNGVQKLESLLAQKSQEKPSVGGLLSGYSGASAGDVDARVSSIMESMNLHEWLPDSMVPGAMNVSGTNISENEMRLHIADMVRQGKSDSEIIQALRLFSGNQAEGAAKQAGSAPVKVVSEDEYNALPSGTKFIDPTGTVRIKP